MLRTDLKQLNRQKGQLLLQTLLPYPLKLWATNNLNGIRLFISVTSDMEQYDYLLVHFMNLVGELCSICDWEH